ncbi:hypothetical protein DM806_09130 [Sphingobium lactosutens]|uniref:hypothetical protein n=1 Tax=Sphingobium lactosutens TaxID=522773 RepID=UPI0015B7F65A|nr:hypothetical protein [Sphingobium lactosutens]NWK95836.1 hypothetical protein [Sphingobium lactosutens]
MTYLAPTALLTGAGIDDPADPHLAVAGHIRLFPYPRLGLPVAPILISRTLINAAIVKRQARHDIEWRNADNQVLTPPFAITPGEPVYGWLPNDGRCVWIELNATPARVIGPIGPIRDVLDPVIRDPRLVIANRLPLDRLPLGRLRALRPRLAGIEITEIEPTERGDSVIQRRSKAPWQLAGSHIRRIRVTGKGMINGASWLDAKRFKPSNVWREWTLPHYDAPRYVSRPSAMSDAKDRVARGAIQREQLYDAPNADAASAPAFADPMGHEVNRIDARYSPDLETMLDRLLTDTSQPAVYLTEPVQSRDDLTGQVVGTINLNLLATMQMAAVDPGMSRWLGLADTDEETRSLPTGTILLYWVDGWWDGAELPKRSLLIRLLRAALRNEPDAAEAFRRRFDRDPPRNTGWLMNLGTIIPLIVGIPPDRPQRPGLGAITSGPWNSSLIPPAAARQVTLPLSGLSPAGQLAFARVDANGPVALHEKAPDGGALPVTAAVLPDAQAPGLGELYDQLAPPDATRYRVAQTDWFGRWSDWVEGLAPAAERPYPPRPVPELFYSQPPIPNPMHSNPLYGLVRIRVGVPQPSQLPAGSLAIANLEVVLNDGVPELIPVPPNGINLDFVRAGPALERAGIGTVKLVCRWQDSAGRFSDPSPPIERDVRDPRPPVAVVLPETLAYGSRPDVTGKSRIQIDWQASPGQAAYRVYHSDETTLMTALEREGAATVSIRAAIAAAPNAAARAAIFIANKNRFDKTRFEAISPDGFTATRFEHRVSGSLRVLVFYRIVPMSLANVETPFDESAMVPFGIPNSGPPSTPLLVVKPLVEAGVPQAAVHIRVPQGPVVATEFRLRRSIVESRDPLRMPVALTGIVPPLPPGAGAEVMQEVVSFRDLGGSELKSPDPLRPWTAYSWAVEVRGAPEAGSSVSGEWSAPSAPVTTAIMPPRPPLPPADGAWDGTMEVSFTHPEPLIGGSMGAYAIDLYMERPGETMTFFKALSADAEASAGGRDPDRTGRFRFMLSAPPQAGTRFRAMITDPGGRTSQPSAELLIA